jgi:hypothetical protein
MLSGGIDADQLVRHYRVDYVVLGPQELAGPYDGSTAYWSAHGERVYSADGYTVYRIR